MPRTRLLQLLFGLGGVLCVPAAVMGFVFAATLGETNALRDASSCPTPTRDASSACLSIFGGRIAKEYPGGKSLRRVTIALEDSTVDVGYGCFESPSGACDSFPIQAGSDVVTGWWKGQLVAFGAPGARPAVVTELNPLDQLRVQTIYLAAAIPGVSLLVAALLLWQAPMNVSELIKTALARWPDPPRPVDSRLMWRVAWGYSSYGAYPFWAVLYVFGGQILFTTSPEQSHLAPLLLVTTLAVALALSALVAAGILTTIVRSSVQRTLVVRRIEPPSAKGRKVTRVWYQRPDGQLATTDLGTRWTGNISEGDHLDALTDPTSGAILRLISTPPAQ